MLLLVSLDASYILATLDPNAADAHLSRLWYHASHLARVDAPIRYNNITAFPAGSSASGPYQRLARLVG